MCFFCSVCVVLYRKIQDIYEENWSLDTSLDWQILYRLRAAVNVTIAFLQGAIQSEDRQCLLLEETLGTVPVTVS